MKKQTKQSNKGCRGRRIKIEVQNSDTLLRDDKSLIQKGKIIGVGPQAICQVGDVVIFNAWGLDKVLLNEKEHYYLLDTDEFVLEIVSE